MVAGETSMVLHGDGSQAMNIDSSALLRRPLPTRAYLLHRAPHLCWDRVVYQASEQMFVGS